MGDPDFFDAKAAGWWCWGLNCWIGSGWCSGSGPWVSENGAMVLRTTAQLGPNQREPETSTARAGVNRQRPGQQAQGVNRQRPHLGDSGRRSACVAAWRALDRLLIGSPVFACVVVIGRACAVHR